MYKYTSRLHSTLIIPVEKDLVEKLPWSSAVMVLDCWNALRVQYSLQYQGGSLSMNVSLLSQHPESPSQLPNSELRLFSKLPWADGGVMVITAYGNPRRASSHTGGVMLLYELPSIGCWWNWSGPLSSWTSAHFVRVSTWSVSSAFSMSAVFSRATTQLCNHSHCQEQSREKTVCIVWSDRIKLPWNLPDTQCRVCGSRELELG